MILFLINIAIIIKCGVPGIQLARVVCTTAASMPSLVLVVSYTTTLSGKVRTVWVLLSIILLYPNGPYISISRHIKK